MRIASRNNVALTRKTIQEKTCWEIIQFEFARQLLLLLVVRCSQVIRSDQSEETRREGFAFKKSKLLCTVKNKTRHSIYFTHHHKKRVSFEYLLYYQETGNHLTSSNWHFWWDILFVIKYFAVWRKFFFFYKYCTVFRDLKNIHTFFANCVSCFAKWKKKSHHVSNRVTLVCLAHSITIENI